MRDTSYQSSKLAGTQRFFQGGEKKVMKKRLLSLVVALAVVVSSFAASAFAATPEDVKGTTYQSPVEELLALGILNGYADGSFKPDGEITRAELAKIIAVATGNEAAANLMKSVKPTFTDVKPNAWYTGYINVAATKGYIEGYKGKFRPNDSITFEEVVAILIRALGYQDKFLPGQWPYNVLLKGQDLGLFSGVDITVGTKATRGIVAKLTSTTLQQAQVTYDAESGVFNEVKKDNVVQKLIFKLGNSESAILTAGTKDSDGNIKLNGANASTASNFVVTGGKTLAGLVGHEVSVLKKSGKVISITDAQSADKVKTGTIEQGAGGNTVIAPGTDVIKLKDVSSKYSVAAGVYSQLNGETQTTIPDGATVKLFLDGDGKVRFVIAKNYNVTNAIFDSYKAASGTNKARVYYDSTSVIVDDNTVVTVNGEQKAFADLVKGDVLDIVRKVDGTASYVEATRKDKVTGKVTAITTTNGTTKYTVNGTDYETVNNITLTRDVEYSLTLNKDNKVAKAETVSGSAAKEGGIVVDVVNDVLIQSETVSGTTQLETRDRVDYYSFAQDKKVTIYVHKDFATANDQHNGELFIELKDANNDGVIDANGFVFKTINPAAPATSVNIDDILTSTIKLGGTEFTFDSSLIVINGSDAGNGNYAKAALADLKKNDGVQYVNDGIKVTHIITKAAGGSASADVYGLFVSASKSVSASGTTYSVTLNVNGEDKTFAVEDTAYNKLDTSAEVEGKDFVQLVASGSKFTDANVIGDVSAGTGTALKTLSGVNKDNSTFTTTVGGPYVATPGDTVVYVIDKNGNAGTGTFQSLVDAYEDYAADSTKYNLYVAASNDQLGATYYKVKAIVLKFKV